MRASILTSLLLSLLFWPFFAEAQVAAVPPPLSNAAAVPLEVKRLHAKQNGRLQIASMPITRAKKQSQDSDWATLHPGSLKENIQRIAKAFGWSRVVWALPEDYRWVGKTRVHAATLPEVLSKILKDYPVQAQFYAGNHVLVIVPRTIQ